MDQDEKNLNFSTVAVEDGEYGFPKKKTVRDPLSHRIIEKRRRDRMNNCLADLARLLPPASLRKGRGRIEKTEIVELAIKHLKHLQCHPCPLSDNCEYNQIPLPRAAHSKSSGSPTSTTSTSSSGNGNGSSSNGTLVLADARKAEEQFRLGFQESLSETMHFLVEKEGMFPGDGLCARLMQHLNGHCEGLLQDDLGNKTKFALGLSTVRIAGKKGNSMSSGYQASGSSGSGSEGVIDRESNGLSQSQPTYLSSYGPLTSSKLLPGASDSGNIFDMEEGNSCSSAPLSLDITNDSFSEKTGKLQTKPPIPSMICSHSSSANSESCTCKLNVRSGSPPTTDDYSQGASQRYKFKNNIKHKFEQDEIVAEDKLSKAGSVKSVLVNIVEGVVNTEEMDQSQQSRKRHTSLTLSEAVAADEAKALRRNTYEAEQKALRRRKGLITSEAVLAKDVKKMSTCSEEVLGAEDQKPVITFPQLNDRKGVPAFALHENGLFYIPLTIDPAIVAPFVGAMEPGVQPPLHPVTISVSFLRPETPMKKVVDLAIPIPVAAVPVPRSSYDLVPGLPSSVVPLVSSVPSAFGPHPEEYYFEQRGHGAMPGSRSLAYKEPVVPRLGLNSDPAVVYQHSHLNPVTTTSSTFYPSTRLTIDPPLGARPRGPVVSSSGVSVSPPTSVHTSVYSSGGSSSGYSSSSSSRKRSSSPSPYAMTAWDHQHRKDPSYGEPFIPRSLGEDHGPASRLAQRVYTNGTSATGPLVVSPGLVVHEMGPRVLQPTRIAPYLASELIDGEVSRDHGLPSKRAKKIGRDSASPSVLDTVPAIKFFPTSATTARRSPQ